MKRYLTIIGLVLAIIEAAVSLIKAFEVPGWGEEKKNIVMSMLAIVFGILKSKFSELVDISWDDIKDMIAQAIDVIVGFLNVVGVFKKSA